MNRFKMFLFSFVTCVFLFPYGINTQNAKVISLNKDNYETELKSHKYLVILFSSSQKSIEYKEELKLFNSFVNYINKETKNNPSSLLSKIAFGQTSIEDSHYIAIKYKISNIPSIILNIRDENRYAYYNGQLSISGLFIWIQKHIISSLHPLNTVTDIEDFIKSSLDIPVLIYFTKYKNHTENEMKFVEKPKGFSIYINNVLSEDHCRFGFSYVNEDIIKHYNLENKLSKEIDTIIAFKQFAPFQDEFTFKRDEEQEFSQETLSNFILSSSFPPLIKYNLISRKILLDYHKPGLILFSKENDPQIEQYKSILSKTSTPYHNNIQAMYASSSTQEEKILEGIIDVNESMFPCIRIIEAKRTNKIFRLDKEITETHLKEFLEQWSKGELNKKIKSEQPHPDDEKRPVIRLVGETINNIMLSRNELDRLVKFSSKDCPWCGYLNPIFEKFAKKYVGTINPLFKMYEIDISKNELGNIRITKTPCIKLWKAHNDENNPIDLEYDGDVTMEVLDLFVNANIKNKLSEIKEQEKSEDL